MFFGKNFLNYKSFESPIALKLSKKDFYLSKTKFSRLKLSLSIKYATRSPF